MRYIHVMKNVTKAFPGGRRLLEDVTLAFLPGAKIGVLGINGAGKSTLLKNHGRYRYRFLLENPFQLRERESATFLKNLSSMKSVMLSLIFSMALPRRRH